MKKKKEVARIWNREKRCWVEVKPLKFFTFRAAPGFKFFLHKALCAKGFSVTEETSGAAVCADMKSKTAAIDEARSRIQFHGVEKLKEAIFHAMEVQENDKARV